MSGELIQPNNNPETEDKFESSIKRHQIRIFHMLGGKAIEFNLANAKIFSHPPEFSQFDHVYRIADKKPDPNVYYFREDYQQLYQDLDACNFPNNRQPFPSIADEKMYYDYQSNRLQRELDKFSNGGDL